MENNYIIKNTLSLEEAREHALHVFYDAERQRRELADQEAKISTELYDNFLKESR